MDSFFLILIAVIILTSVYLNTISSRIGMPTLLVFMLLGILFANNGLLDIEFDDYSAAKDTCTVALIFIMFYGGFGTRWEAVKPVVKEAGLLATIGVVLTAGLVGTFCHFALGWKWVEGLLLGSVISSTDAASVFSILRGKRLGLKNDTAPLLEVESGSNDPASYMLTAVMLSILGGSASGWHIAWDIFAQLFFGTALGLGIGKLAALGFRNIHFQTQGFDSLYIFAVAIAAYAIPSILGGNGYLSAYLVGIILGNEEFKNKKTLVSFFDGLTGLMQVLIFFLLGLLARPAMMHKAILPALAVFVFLLLVARPAAVFSILTPFKKYPFRQQALISFVGLRGAASIVFAIMAIVTATDLNKDIFNIVFVLVLMSIALQGSLIPWVAKKLDMLDKGSDVMKTFNDYSEEEDVTFSRINLREDSSWTGKTIGELSLPRTMLVVLVLRDGERIQPKGDTLLKAGDSVITLTHAFNGSEASLYEKTVKVGSRRVGRPMSEHPGAGLVVMIRRGDKSLIPSGDTILQAGDRLVILNLSGEKKI